MKIIDCIQGSNEWLAARLKIPTASRFGEIVTPTGKPVTGQARYKYALELVGERLTGRTQDHPVTSAMMRGTELEPRARAWYRLVSGKAVSEVGFILSDCGRWGASPDGITDTGGLEIKCPGRLNLLEIADTRELPKDWYVQVQANMWVCGKRKSWDFCLFTDEQGMPCLWWTIPYDKEVHAAFDEELPRFCDEVDELEKRIRRMGNG